MKIKRFYLIFILVTAVVALFVWIRLRSATIWDGQRRFTLVVVSDPVLVMSMEPLNRYVAVFTIPPNMQLDVPFGYGAYPVQSVYHLGELDPKRGGGNLIAKAVENTFGIWVDGYVVFGDQNLKLPAQFSWQIPKIKKQYFSWSGLIRNLPKFFFRKEKLTSNLSFIDQANVWLTLKQIRQDKIIYLDFEKRGILAEKNLADGSVVKSIDSQLASIIIADHFEDRQIRAENISLEIVNASGIDRLATQFALILSNLGGSVMVKSTGELEGDFPCRLMPSDNAVKSSMIVKRLVQYYHCQMMDNLKEKGTVQLKLILGKEFYQ